MTKSNSDNAGVAILRYETALKTGKFVLIAHGTQEETTRARELINRTHPEAWAEHQPSPATPEHCVVAAYSRHRTPSLNQTKHTIMKHKTLLLTFLAAVVFALGCNKEPTTSQQLDKLQTETKQAAQDMKDYTYAQKSAFVETMQAQLAALNRDLDQLAAKVEKSSDAVKAEAKPKLQALRDQAGKLNQQLDEVKNATESTWDSVKNGFNKAYASSKDGFNQARQWVSDKIAP